MGWQDAPEVKDAQAGAAWASAPEVGGNAQPTKPAPGRFVPSGELDQPSALDPEMIAANPVTRFSLGAASPAIAAAQINAKMPAMAFGPMGLPIAVARQISERLGITPDALFEHLAQLNRMKQGSGGWGTAAEIVGTVLNPAGLAATKALPVATTVMGRVGQGAGVGAAYGAGTPTTGDPDAFASEKAVQTALGGVIGGGISGGIEVATPLVRGAYHVAEPYLPGGAKRIMARTLNTAAGPRREGVMAELRADRRFVPGSAPTAGEAAAPAGSAEFSALQKIVDDVNPSQAVATQGAQEAARRGALQGIGKDPAALAAAEAARDTTAGALYNEARRIGVDPEAAQMLQPQIKNLMQRLPHGVKEKARELARLEGETLGPEGSVNGLHWMKQAIDDMLSSSKQTGIGSQTQRALMQYKNDLLTVMDDLSPMYAKGRETYAAMSRPINEMEVGQYLENALVKPLGAGERAAALANAVRNAPATLKKSTGFGRYQELADVLQQHQVQSVEGVVQDLSRRAQFEQLAKAGTSEARDQLGRAATGIQLPGMVDTKVTIAKAILSRLQGRASDKILHDLAIKMQDPRVVEQLMASFPPGVRLAIVNDAAKHGLGRNQALIGLPAVGAAQTQ